MKISRREYFKRFAGACAAAGITTMQAATIKPEDVIVLRHPGRVRESDLTHLRDEMRLAFPKRKVLILEDGWTIETLTTSVRNGSISIDQARAALGYKPIGG